MRLVRFVAGFSAVVLLAGVVTIIVEAQQAQPPVSPPARPEGGPSDRPPRGPEGGPGGFMPGGRGFPGGPGGFGGPGGPNGERELVQQFDKDNDKRLSSEERMAARESIKKDQAARGGRRGGGFGPRGGSREPAKPGAKIAPADVPAVSGKDFYDTTVLRTLFLDFETPDWEAELADFYHTDVDVPATLTVDGKKYPQVGVSFRGASSYFSVSPGFKRSMKLSIDFADGKQRLYGYRTINLLNSNGDPTFIRAILFSHIARQYIPSPKANLVRLVINGENWGIYVNAQQVNSDFLKESYSTGKGTRWKAPGSPRGGAGLEYKGEDLAPYKSLFEMKTNGGEKEWKALVELCRVLNQTPPDKLKEALSPLLDIDSALKFLALDNAVINEDGYWTRASDFHLYLDPKGKFHVIPHDANETFHEAMGFGRGMRGPGGGGAGGYSLDPLVAARDSGKPLLSKLLAVPEFRAQYLTNVRTIAEQSMDWDKLAPLATQLKQLVDKEVEADTKKLSSIEAFRAGIDGGTVDAPGPFGRRPQSSLKTFVEQRRAYLLNHPEIKALGNPAVQAAAPTTRPATGN